LACLLPVPSASACAVVCVVVYTDVLLAAGGAEDSFAEVRKVQASAGQYPTSDAYYDALNSAIARWRSKRQGDLGGYMCVI
jgi:hypothetical protein